MIVQVTPETKEFKKLQQLLQRKCHTKKELCVTLSLLRLYVKLVMLYKIVSFRLLDMNGFPVKAENERITSVGS